MTKRAATSALLVKEAIKQGCAQIGHLADNPRLEAEILLAEAIGKSRTYLHAWPEQIVPTTSVEIYSKFIELRSTGTPIAYILGKREFWSLSLEVNADTLIPRPETELLVEVALDRIDPQAKWSIADLGTGSGAIALALASERRLCQLIGIDNSSGALAVARRNAARLKLTNLELVLGDWVAPLATNRVQMLVSNPPYVRDQDPHLRQGDARFEPRSALSSGSDGLRDIGRIIASANSCLAPNGTIILEHGYEQGPAVRNILDTQGFSSIKTYRDLAGHERVSAAVIGKSDF